MILAPKGIFALIMLGIFLLAGAVAGHLLRRVGENMYLDNYIREHYQLFSRFGGYRVWRRVR